MTPTLISVLIVMRNEAIARKRKTLQMAGCAGAALLVLVCILQAGVFLAHTSHNVAPEETTSCPQPNYQYDCQDGGCQFSVRWWRQADVVHIELTTLVSDVAEGIRTAIVFARNAHKAVFMCQWSKEGHSLANCSLPEGGEARQVGCPIANTTFLNPLLKCSFGVPFDSPWLESPVSLEISHSGPGGSVQQAGPKCLCDIRDCLDTCSCGVTSSKCDSSLYLLLIRSHAIVMVIVFLLLLPTGVMISRYSRPVFPHSWFRAHVLANTTGLFFMLLGLAAILVHTKGAFYVGLHQIVGIICISLAIFQVLYGFLRPVAGTSLRRLVFSYVHRFTGTAILGLGTLAMLLGAILYKNSVYTVVVTVVVVAILVEVALIVTMEIITRRNYVISPPVGYQRVQGRGDDDGEGEGEGEGESDKELYVKEGHITHPKTNPEEVSKPHPAHTSIKRVLAVFLVQGFVFSAVVSILLSYGEH